MNRLWRAAIAACGLSAVAAFVFWSLYKHWLTLPIFSQIDSQQTFVIMLVFLSLTFLALIAMLVVYVRSHRAGTPSFSTETADRRLALLSVGHDAKWASVAQNIQKDVPMELPPGAVAELRKLARQAGLNPHDQQCGDELLRHYFDQLGNPVEQDLFNMGAFLAQLSAGEPLLKTSTNDPVLAAKVSEGLKNVHRELRVLLAKYGVDDLAEEISEDASIEEIRIFRARVEAGLRRSLA